MSGACWLSIVMNLEEFFERFVRLQQIRRIVTLPAAEELCLHTLLGRAVIAIAPRIEGSGVIRKKSKTHVHLVTSLIADHEADKPENGSIALTGCLLRCDWRLHTQK